MIDIMQVKVCAAPARPASALPISRPGAVFARDESAAPRARGATAERILLIEDDFLVATQIEAALIDAGFAIAGVGSSADEAIELASHVLPKTSAIFGRVSAPASHRLYYSKLAATSEDGRATIQFKDPTRFSDELMLLEVRWRERRTDGFPWQRSRERRGSPVG